MTRPAAVTRAADPHHPIRPTAAFSSPRRTLTGSGEALRIELPAPWTDHVELVAEALAGFEVDDEVRAPGTGPVAFGALPFEDERGGAERDGATTRSGGSVEREDVEGDGDSGVATPFGLNRRLHGDTLERPPLEPPISYIAL